MQACQFDLPLTQNPIADDAADHAGQCAGAVGPRPVEAEHQRPEEHRLQATEGEQVEPDDHLGRLQCRQQHQSAEDQGTEQGEARNAYLQLLLAGLLRIEIVEVEILHQSGGGLDQLGVDGRHDGRHRRCQKDSGQPRRQHFHHQGGHDLVRTVHARQDGAPQRAGQMHAKHQQGAHYGTDQNAAMERLAVAIAKAAQRRVGQPYHPDTDQDPEAQHERLGQHVAGPLRAHQFGIDHLELVDKVWQAITGDQNSCQQGTGADQHDDPLQGIGHHHRTEATDDGVEQHAAGKQH